MLKFLPVENVNEKVKAIIPAKSGDNDGQAILFSAKDWHLRANFENGKIVAAGHSCVPRLLR